VAVGKQRTRNLGLSQRDIDRTMAEPKPLTYDECKAAEAAFKGAPSNPDWTEAAQQLYARLSAVIDMRAKGSSRRPTGINPEHLTGIRS
jgi:hypothetical protein